MKKSCLILLTSILLNFPLSARDITFDWDASPAEEAVVSYDLEIHDGTDWISIGTSPTNSLRDAAFPDTLTRCRVTAINSLGVRGVPSSELVLPADGDIPSSITGFRATLNAP
jgi:hypothetical protein